MKERLGPIENENIIYEDSIGTMFHPHQMSQLDYVHNYVLDIPCRYIPLQKCSGCVRV